MPNLSPNKPVPSAPRLGSVRGSAAYLHDRCWWPAFRDRHRAASLIDDLIWVGHFCDWIERHGVPVEQCSFDDLEGYLDTVQAFRPGPRAACRRTVRALVEFMVRGRAEHGDAHLKFEGGEVSASRN